MARIICSAWLCRISISTPRPLTTFCATPASRSASAISSGGRKREQQGARRLSALLRPHRSWIARAPAARIDLREEIADRLVEQRRLLDIHRVAALGKNRQARGRDHPLEIDARLE